jgi:hypothetical protein
MTEEDHSGTILPKNDLTNEGKINYLFIAIDES